MIVQFYGMYMVRAVQALKVLLFCRESLTEEIH
jgi:hypothetical protein